MFDHQKETSIEVHQERRVFKVDARFYLVGHGVQHERRLVAAISHREGSSLCLTSLEPTMELNSLWQSKVMFKRLAKKPYKLDRARV